MQNLSFRVGPIKNRSSQVRPVIEFHFRNNNDIDCNPERTKQRVQLHQGFAGDERTSFE